MQLIEISDAAAWDAFVNGSEWGHPLQLWGWGETKRSSRWTPHRLALTDGEQWTACAQVLEWRVPKLGRSFMYVPRGPVVAPGSVAAQQMLDALVAWARSRRALYVRVEPAWCDGAPVKPWRRSRHKVQMSATYTLDLAKSPEELMAPMSHKHRQYIRRGERDRITVDRVRGSELAPMYWMYAETAQRARFGIHGQDYYERLAKELGEHSYLYYAKHEDKPVAFLWLAGAGRTAYELYGGVTAAGQELKANYLLKWRAIEEMKAAGYGLYDFNGRVTEGVAQFKAGFGADRVDWIGTWDYPLNRTLYTAWEGLWPLAKPVGRWLAGARGRARRGMGRRKVHGS
jgi:lipid II:glycine glycyltransferase (peptidoglycan interpeptide bridge formation enzyme)